ncbi:uncharacterized protein B0I36DRAFT_315980 [Microdochium trichocladiopsis]|uniref:Uncharacterized protein n=1 Tax=Microdochium trichocladiopsis TaxID=1682393 RepID=A0A9P8YHL6_9PEZI|nr:uncharacterized protein B0I36DRAFT_315980 [Microdochium trichocladiopsis]KAH7038310.1 hypothetical protein B0I36DRAFT_315980 [Microdochium trichocladiopsis]
MLSASTFSKLLQAASIAFGIVPIGFEVNWYYSTASGLSFFHLDPPAVGSEHRPTVDCMASVIGVRNFALGTSMVAAALMREKRTLGVLYLSFAVIAFVDGVATNRAAGEGGGDHWSYIHIVAGLGIANLWTAG